MYLFYTKCIRGISSHVSIYIHNCISYKIRNRRRQGLTLRRGYGLKVSYFVSQRCRIEGLIEKLPFELRNFQLLFIPDQLLIVGFTLAELRILYTRIQGVSPVYLKLAQTSAILVLVPSILRFVNLPHASFLHFYTLFSSGHFFLSNIFYLLVFLRNERSAVLVFRSNSNEFQRN